MLISSISPKLRIKSSVILRLQKLCWTLIPLNNTTIRPLELQISEGKAEEAAGGRSLGGGKEENSFILLSRCMYVKTEIIT